MIHLNRPVTFYDDRSKYDEDMRMVEVLWFHTPTVLCLAQFPNDPEKHIILFDQITGEVLTHNFESFNAENPKG